MTITDQYTAIAVALRRAAKRFEGVGPLDIRVVLALHEMGGRGTMRDLASCLSETPRAAAVDAGRRMGRLQRAGLVTSTRLDGPGSPKLHSLTRLGEEIGSKVVSDCYPHPLAVQSLEVVEAPVRRVGPKNCDECGIRLMEEADLCGFCEEEGLAA